MALSPGTRLGPYEILAPIGAGGMGEVYRAHDSRLGRDVAVPPESFALSPDGRSLVCSTAETLHSLMLVQGLPGIAPDRAVGRP